MYNFSAKFRSIFRILSVYLMSLLMFSGNSYGMESDPNQNYDSIDNYKNRTIKLDVDNESKSVNGPLSVAIFGENEEEVNKITRLLWLNDSNKPLGFNAQIPYQEDEPQHSSNDPNLRFVVIPYEHGNLQKTIVNQFGKESFDYFDFIIHVSNKDTLTADRIKSFYDTLNYAWLGKDYNPIYSPFGESCDKFWKKACAKRKDSTIPKTLFFIFNGDLDELYKLDEYSTVKNYISAMPDSRSIYALELNNPNVKFEKFIDAMNTIAQAMSKDISLKRIKRLEEIFKKKNQLLGTNSRTMARVPRKLNMPQEQRSIESVEEKGISCPSCLVF